MWSQNLSGRTCDHCSLGLCWWKSHWWRESSPDTSLRLRKKWNLIFRTISEWCKRSGMGTKKSTTKTPPTFISQRHQIPFPQACWIPIQINQRHYQWQSILLFNFWSLQSITFLLKLIGWFSSGPTIFHVCCSIQKLHSSEISCASRWSKHTCVGKEFDDVGWQKWAGQWCNNLKRFHGSVVFVVCTMMFTVS